MKRDHTCKTSPQYATFVNCKLHNVIELCGDWRDDVYVGKLGSISDV